MTTAQRAEALHRAAKPLPDLCLTSAETLTHLVTRELSHAEILDDFQAYGSIHAQAVAPASIFHVVGSNTPLAALQSLIRGLLLGSRNRVKLPSGGLAEVDTFIGRLPNTLQALVETEETLNDAWLREAEVVVAFGSDETIAYFRQRCRPHQVFLAHGHRISFGVVYDDAEASLAGAATDVCKFDQKGCLSLHTIYVDVIRCGPIHAYGKRLAEAMRNHIASNPIGDRSDGERTEIQHLRGSYAFRAANDPRVSVFESEGSTEWTVICEEDPLLAASCTNCVVYVKPLPNSLSEQLIMVHPHLSTIAIWPFDLDTARSLSRIGASRICAIGNAQEPSFFWHQDGMPTLANMVRWVDAG